MGHDDNDFGHWSIWRLSNENQAMMRQFLKSTTCVADYFRVIGHLYTVICIILSSH